MEETLEDSVSSSTEGDEKDSRHPQHNDPMDELRDYREVELLLFIVWGGGSIGL